MIQQKTKEEILKSCKGVWYSLPNEAINKIKISAEKNELFENKEVFKHIVSLITEQFAKKKVNLVAFDGFLGVNWEDVFRGIKNELEEKVNNVQFIDFSSYYKESDEIEKIVTPYLNVDPDWGYVYRGRLEDFLNMTRLKELKMQFKDLKRRRDLEQLVVCFGCGAVIPSLRKFYDIIFYVDVTLEELFRRSREERPVFALGSMGGSPVHKDIKRFFYVDHMVLKKQKKYLLNYINWYILDENGRDYKMISPGLLDRICLNLTKSPFRPKPFYIPGVWGGEWLKTLKPDLKKSLPSPDIPISWEIDVVDKIQNIRVAIDKKILEIPFLIILWKEGKKILGEYVYKKYRGRLPLTMSYDDTYSSGPLAKGEGLAIQVHPHRSYLKKHFNENFAQHESYYILDTGPGAKTYQGLKENVEIEEFYKDVIRAKSHGIPFNHNKYVNSFPSKRGDLFLNPAGTIHASGFNQVVLEPDLVPVEFSGGYTFHFYDYLRIDLDGKPRGIHLEHAFKVLKRDRRTKWVIEHLQLKPKLIRTGNGWAEFVIGECEESEYKMCRLEFIKEIEDNTHRTVQLLTLVDGNSVLIKSEDGKEEFKLNFGETAVVPASFGKYVILCLHRLNQCKVLKFFIKIRR